MAEENAVKKPGLIQKFGLLIFAVLNFVVMGGISFLIYTVTLGYKDPKIVEAEEVAQIREEMKSKISVPIYYTMDKFIVNLDGQAGSAVRTIISLEMLDEQGFEEIVSLGAKPRDAIIRILNGKRFRELETIQGKLFLKEQIVNTVNKFLAEGIVKDVYFSEFVVQ